MTELESNKSTQPKWGPIVALLLPVACLLPFVNKAVHIDDTVYLWVAQQIQQDPVNFFGFMVNWDKQDEWVYEFNKNPPGISYLIALAAALVGWQETGLHLIFLIPPALAGLGIYILARDLSAPPLPATAVAVLSPVFIVSSTNLMCESTMLALYVWSVILWIRGLKTKNPWWLLSAGMLIGMGSLVKYVSISLIPLLFVYTLVHQRRLTTAVLYFLVPLLILVGYDMASRFLYDTSLLLGAANFSIDFAAGAPGGSIIRKALINLAFTGGCFIGTFFLVPFLWSWRAVIALCASFAGIVLLLIINGGLDTAYVMYEGSRIRIGYLLQTALFLTAGLNLFALLLADIWRHRDKETVLLVLWIAGIFVFGAFVNWRINARALLPMAPAVGILVARRFHFRIPEQLAPARVAVPFLLAAAVSIAVAWGDYRYAETGRAAANEIAAMTPPTGVTRFQGHHGFQYYMERFGYLPFQVKANDPIRAEQIHVRGFRPSDIGLFPGDRAVVPTNDSNFRIGEDDEGVRLVNSFTLSPSRWVATMNRDLGVGFYSFGYGPLPYYFGDVPPEEYRVYDIFEAPTPTEAGAVQ